MCQRIQDGFGMPAEWALRIMVPIFKGKGDIRNCSWHEGGGKGVRKRLCRIVSVDEMQFGFIPEGGTINAVFIFRRMQQEYHAKEKKLYKCFVDLEKASDRVPRKVLEWAIRKKGIPDIMVRSVINVYEGAKM